VLVAVVSGGVGYWRYSRAHQAPDVQFKTVALEKRRIVGRITAIALRDTPEAAGGVP